MVIGPGRQQHEYPVVVERHWINIAFGFVAALVGVAYGVAVAASLSPVYLLGGPAVIVLVVLAVLKPELAAVALLGITWGYLSEIAVKFHGVPSPSKSLVALLTVSLIIRRFTNRRVPFRHDATLWWMSSYLFLISLGLLYAANPDKTLLLAVDFLKDLLLFFLLINLITTPQLFQRGIWTLLAIGALLGSITVYQEVTGRYDINYGGLARPKIDAAIADGFDNRPRAGGPTNEPLAFGQQLLVLVPFGLCGIRHTRRLSAKAFAAFSVAMSLAGIGLSFSRSTYIALAVTLVLYLVHVHLNLRYVSLILLLLLGLVGVAPPELTARFSTLEQLIPNDEMVNLENQGLNSEASYQMRSIQLQMAISMFFDRPLIGVGGWNFTVHYPQYLQQSGSPIAASFGPPHNYYIEIAAEHGLVGLFVVGGILLLAYSRMRFARQRFLANNNHCMADLAAALQIGFVGYLVSAFFLHGLYSRFLWLQVAMAVALALIARGEGRQATAHDYVPQVPGLAK